MPLGVAQGNDRHQQDGNAETDDESAGDPLPLPTSGELSGQPSMLRIQCSNLDTQSTCRPLALATRPQPAQSLHQHRIGRERSRSVDECVEHLVVAGCGHVEKLTDGLFLRTSVLPPLALERQDLPVAAGEAVRGSVGVAVCGCGVHGLHAKCPPTSSYVMRYLVRFTARLRSSRIAAV